MKLLYMLILLVTLAPDDDEHLMSGMPAVLLVPLIATAVCGAIPRLRRSRKPWALALKAASLGCLTMIALSLLLLICLGSIVFFLFGPEPLFFLMIVAAAIVAGFLIPLLIQRWLLRCSGGEPVWNFGRTLVMTAALVLLTEITATFLIDRDNSPVDSGWRSLGTVEEAGGMALEEQKVLRNDVVEGCWYRLRFADGSTHWLYWEHNPDEQPFLLYRLADGAFCWQNRYAACRVDPAAHDVRWIVMREGIPYLVPHPDKSIFKWSEVKIRKDGRAFVRLNNTDYEARPAPELLAGKTYLGVCDGEGFHPVSERPEKPIPFN